jgi:hypothetical protein
MSIQDVATASSQLKFDFLPSRDVVLESVDDHMSTDGGLLVIREWDEKAGWTAEFASQLQDIRQASSVVHSVLDMVRARVYGILAGYEDQNDHDILRSDAVLKLIAGRLPEDPDLASQPTLSRFENSIEARDLLNLEQWFIDRFVSGLESPRGELTLDLDVFDDPTHGEQQLTFFHGFYEQYQYLVRVLTCANNDQVIVPTLLYGTARPALGMDDDLRRVVDGLRGKFPDQRIHLRMDSGFAAPATYELCEELRIDYSIGLAMNPVLKKNSRELLAEAEKAFQETHTPQRLFTGFEYQAESWTTPRWVVVKCEVNARGTNQRAVVTNRPGARICPGAAYDEYADRGESENRNKELKCELSADRLSDHRFMANCFRIFLHCLANNLLLHLRRSCVEPLPTAPSPAPSGTLPVEPVPTEALSGRARRAHFNKRRRHDPLGDGQACTWRMMIIKVAARIRVSARRVHVQLSSTWPYLKQLLELGNKVNNFRMETS